MLATVMIVALIVADMIIYSSALEVNTEETDF
jgi:hypothetical protein